MNRIALICAAVALIAAAPQEPSPPLTPVAASTAEPCLPPPRPGPNEGARSPARSRDWYRCTSAEVEAAIRRQCSLEQQPETDAHAACVADRSRALSDRTMDLWGLSAEDLVPARATTTRAAADHACRGQTWRRPEESVQSCSDRLVATDALSLPLPEGRSPTGSGCRRESVRNEDGTGFRFSVRCTETTGVPASPR